MTASCSTASTADRPCSRSVVYASLAICWAVRVERVPKIVVAPERWAALASNHVASRPYEELGFPSDDPLHLIYLAMIVVVVVLHVVAFAVVVSDYRKTGEYPPDL
nr:hypothetical protein [Salinadaptatus halalkaliphilus]